MNSNQILLIACPKHPLYSALGQLGLPLFDTNPSNLLAFLENTYPKNPLLIEFTLDSYSEKIQWLKRIPIPMLLEGSTLWGESLLDALPMAIGLHSAAFWSPRQKVECFIKKDQERIAQFFEQINLKIHPIASPGIGMHYPRVISMIINESMMALEDHLAPLKNLDRAMKEGARYPLGPCEWKKKIGALPIVLLLDELYRILGNPRYRVAPSLRREAIL